MQHGQTQLSTAYRDESLNAYALLKKGDMEEAGAALDRLAASGFPPAQVDLALWLWAASEYAARLDSSAWLDERRSRLEESIRLVAEHWRVPEPHWLHRERQGLYLSNLAIAYGALQGLHSRLRSDLAQRTAKEMRQAAFAEYMRGERFVSERDTDLLWGDIGTAAVPFGLITAGDLALVSAVSRLDENELPSEEAAMLAWYFAESKQAGRAKRLVDRLAGAEVSQLASIAIAQAAGNGASQEMIQFHHDPIGDGNPYRPSWNGRSPRVPAKGDKVVIRTFAEPFDPEQPPVLVHWQEGELPQSEPMKAAYNEEGEGYWEASIEHGEEDRFIGYRFESQARTEEHTEVVRSPSYTYSLAAWVEAELDERSGESLIFQCEPLKLKGRCLRLKSSQGETASATKYVLDTADLADLAALPDANHEPSTAEAGAITLPRVWLLAGPDAEIYKLRLEYPLTEEERIYGMGERFTRLSFRGCEVDHYVYNQYKDQGLRTYIPVPFLLSSEGYGLFLNTDLYSVFRCGSNRSDTLEIEADLHPAKQVLEWRLYKGSPLDLIEGYTATTGKPKLPPKWAFGPWMSSNNWDSEQEVNRQLELNKTYDIPSTVIVLEQWSDEASFYIFNDAQYEPKAGSDRFSYLDFTFPEWGRWPNPMQMVERIHEQGLKVLLWQAPVMKFMDGIAHEQRDKDEAHMLEAGYAVRRKDGQPYRIPAYEWFRGSLVPDFTNPAGTQWWLGKRQYLLDEIGIDGIKTDGGECIYGADATFHDGRDGLTMRNAYPNTYVGAFHRFIESYTPDGGLTFSRAGYSGAQRTPMHWAGDEKSTFEAFRASIVAGISSGLSGLPFWGWDLGGFSGGIPTAELYIRSVQMAAFCPVMQYHAESRAEFNQDRTPWNIAERHNCPEVLTIYKRYADLRMNLLPYIYEQARHSSESGHPLMRAMWLDYPEDPQCADLSLQYMFGENLLVAPVTTEGATAVRTYLPLGEWQHLFTGKCYRGGEFLESEAELSDIPVFIRANSVIPLNLDESGSLPSAIGNQWQGYTCLTLLAYVTGNVDYRFEDPDHPISVRLQLRREDERWTGLSDVKGAAVISLLVRNGSVTHLMRLESGKQTFHFTADQV